MKKCYRCNTKSPKEFRYCRRCGCSFRFRYCGKGHINPVNAQYCNECGSEKMSTPDGGENVRLEESALVVGGAIVAGLFGIFMGLLLLGIRKGITPVDVWLATASLISTVLR